MAFSLFVCKPRVFFSPYKEGSDIELGPTLMTSLNLSYFFKLSVSKTSYLRVRASTYDFGGNIIQSIIPSLIEY